MVHLCVHLPQEAILGGPVQSRWMYPIERYLGHLKRYVRNKAKPEGSIAEGYVVEEAINFCSHYLRGVESKLEKRGRNDDNTSSDARSFVLDIFRVNGRGIGKKEVYNLSSILMKKAIWFIFNNCHEVQPYLEEHLQFLQRQHPESSDFSEMQRSTFADWFAKRIRDVYSLNPSQMNEELYALSCPPDNRVLSQKGYIVNGVKFLVKSRDDRRQTQNCGVMVPGVHNDVEDDYYGYLDEVIEISFIRCYRVVLFKCTWFDTDRRRKHVTFEPHFISIDTSHNAYKEDPFILQTRLNKHLWDIPEHKNAEDFLEEVNLLHEDIMEEIIENVDDQGSNGITDDFVDDEITDSDHSMEDFGSESHLGDSDTENSNDEINSVESDDDDL
ncbi:uncharacterized protein LOC143589798 [Bidens hawaiensis]|uniref:uncharacterized protein LOC143589798 n=1 Tax=Bidens hawaiensis TaxID=980011 RepID=UPI00404B8CF9